MKVSKAGEHLMHFFEGYRNKPYRCSAAIWTVGWGHAMYKPQYARKNRILIDDRKDTIDAWRAKGGIGIHHISTTSTIKQLKQLGL